MIVSVARRPARFNARDFNINLSVSGTALAANINGAVAEINALGGGTLQLPETTGAFAPASGLTLLDGVYLEGSGVGATVFDFTASTIAAGSAISGTGTLTALPALAANVALHSKSLVFASSVAATVAVGDVLVIYDSLSSSYSPDGPSWRAGEFVRVVAVSTTTVTISTALWGRSLATPTVSYVAGGTVSVYKLNPIRTGVSGISMTAKQGKSGITVSLGEGLRFKDLYLTGTNHSHLQLDRSYNCAIDGVTAIDASSGAVGLNYGVTLANSQRISISDCFLETTRHGLTLGGGTATGSVPCREVTVTGGTISSHSTGAGINGFNTHPNVEGITLTGVSLPHGVTIGGDKTVLRSCYIGAGAAGVAGYYTVLGMSHVISDCVIEANENWAGVNGLIYVAMQSDCIRTDGVFRIDDVTIHLNGHESNDAGKSVVYIANFAGDNGNHVAINNLSVDGGKTTYAAAYAITVGCSSGKAFDTIAITNCPTLIGHGIKLLTVNYNRLLIDGVTITDARERGVLQTWNAAPVYADPIAIMRRISVLGAQHCGVQVAGPSSAAGMLILEDLVSLSCAIQATGGSNTQSSLWATAWDEVIYRRSVVGDRQATPTQTRSDAFDSIGTLREDEREVLGTVTAKNRLTVTTRKLRGRGTGTPEAVEQAEIGSTWQRTDGGFLTSFYIKESGTGNAGWVAK